MMEDCKKCNQTVANCECHIPDREKHSGLYNLIETIMGEEEYKPITVEDLKDEGNLLQCECGNYSHWDYMFSNDSGNSCPACHQEWLNGVIKMYRTLLRELADPSLKKEDIDQRIKAGYADLYGISVEDFEEWVEQDEDGIEL